MQKEPKLQRARWSVPLRPCSVINLTKNVLTYTAGGGGGAPPLKSAIVNVNKLHVAAIPCHGRARRGGVLVLAKVWNSF